MENFWLYHRMKYEVKWASNFKNHSKKKNTLLQDGILWILGLKTAIERTDRQCYSHTIIVIPTILLRVECIVQSAIGSYFCCANWPTPKTPLRNDQQGIKSCLTKFFHHFFNLAIAIHKNQKLSKQTWS